MSHLYKYVIHVLHMILQTEAKRQGNSNVIILPKKLGLKPSDKVCVLVIKGEVSRVEDIAGLFKENSGKRTQMPS